MFLVMASLSSGCLSPYERSERALEQGDFETARAQANRALDADDDGENPRAHLLLARIHVEQEAYEEAKPHAKKAFDHDSTRADGGRLLGKIQWERGEPVAAAKTWGEARDAESSAVGDDDYRKALKVGIQESRRTHAYRDALDLQQRLHQFDPDHELASIEERRETRRSLAAELVEAGELEAAEALYDELADELDDPTLWFEIGQLGLRLDETDSATEAFNRFVRTDDPSTTAARARKVADAAADLDHHDMAVDFLLRSREAHESASFKRAKLELTLANELFILGRDDTGRQYVDIYLDTMRELRGRPLSADVYLTAADTATDHDQSTFAAELLEKALVDAPPDWNVAARLAQHYAVQVREKEVSRVLNTYVERSSNPEHESFAKCAGWAADRENYVLAQQFYRRAIDAKAEAPNLRMALADILDRQGDIEQLKQTLDAFVERFPDRRHQLMEAASLYANHGLYRDAESVLKRLRDRYPKSLVTVDRLAALYREWGKTDRIKTAYQDWLDARGGDAADYRLVGERFARHDANDVALEFLEISAERGETDAWRLIADLYNEQQRSSKMREALERYLAAENRSPNALRAVLDRLENSPLNEFKVEVLTELIDQDPSEREYYEQLASVRVSQGNQQAAFDVWRRYVDRAGRSVDTIKEIGEWFQASGHPELALPFYHLWLDKIDDPRLFRLIGTAYLATGRRDNIRQIIRPETRSRQRSYAREYFERYLEAGDFEQMELLEFASMLRQHSMWQPAARAYDRALREVSGGDAAQLQHALTLLKLGHAGRARSIHEAYFESRGDSTAAADKIADQLTDADLYRSALPYLKKLMGSEIPDLRRKSFTRQLEAFVKLDRHDAIDGLIETYLDEAANPAKSRQLVTQSLAQRGLVGRAADQIEKTRDLQGDVMGLELGTYYLQDGALDRAWKQFDTYANNHSFGTQAWLEVAKEYERRGMPDATRRALDRAVETSSDGHKAHLQRAVFAVHNGNTDRAAADYNTALDRAESDTDPKIHKAYVEALRSVGRFGEARAIVERVRSSVTANQPFFARRYFEDALRLTTRERSRRLVDNLIDSPLELGQKVSILHERGYLEDAAELIERELENGNLATAGRALTSNPSVASHIGGRAHLARLARPLLRSSSLDQPLRARLGAYLIHQGDYRSGIRFLSASQTGKTLFWPMLVQAHANLGQTTRALNLVREYETAQRAARPQDNVWDQTALRFGLAGRDEAFRDGIGLERIGPEADPVLIRLQTEHFLATGDASSAIERLHRLATPDTADSRVAGPEVQRRVDQVTAGISALTEYGYQTEADTLIEMVDSRIRKHDTFRQFEERYTLRYHPEQPAAEDAPELNSPPVLEELMDRTETAMLARRFERADNLLERLPNQMTPGYEHRAAAIRTLLAHLQDDQTDKLPTLSVSDSENRLGGTRSAYRTARHLGWDDEAFEYMSEAFEQSPSATAAMRLLTAAEATGSRTKATRATDRYFRYGKNPLDQMSKELVSAARRLDPDVLEPMFARLASVRGASLDLRLARAMVDIRTGAIERARGRLIDYLQRVEFDPVAVDRVVAFLQREELHSEVVHVLRSTLARRDGDAPADDRPIVRQTLMTGALAAASLGFNDRFDRWTERALEGAPTKATLAQRSALDACRRHLQPACRRLAERATALAPERPPGWFALGIADILDGESATGRQHIERGLRGGVDRSYALKTAGRAALTAGDEQLANDYLEALVQTPNPSQMNPLQPLQRAISTYNRADASEVGVRMIEQRFPHLAAGRGPAGRRASRVLTSLYQGAGNHQKAFQMYRATLDNVWLRTDLRNDATAVLLNNLSYAYATAGQNLGEAETLVTLALGFSRQRTSSYLDTRGWIRFKQGRLEAAERDIRRAIRTTETDASLGELYDHLAQVQRRRGDEAGAYWLDRFARTYQ